MHASRKTRGGACLSPCPKHLTTHTRTMILPVAAAGEVEAAFLACGGCGGHVVVAVRRGEVGLNTWGRELQQDEMREVVWGGCLVSQCHALILDAPSHPSTTMRSLRLCRWWWRGVGCPETSVDHKGKGRHRARRHPLATTAGVLDVCSVLLLVPSLRAGAAHAWPCCSTLSHPPSPQPLHRPRP